jgi:hypothetical protein
MTVRSVPFLVNSLAIDESLAGSKCPSARTKGAGLVNRQLTMPLQGRRAHRLVILSRGVATRETSDNGLAAVA